MTQATLPATDTVRIALDERSYDIAIGADMLASLAQRADVPAGTAALVVSNTVVQPLYGAALAAALRQRYPVVHSVVLPDGEEQRLDARLWDRFFDLYVSQPMQKIVTDRIRPEGGSDPVGVAEARRTLDTAYAMIEERMAGRAFACGEGFTIADCAALPGLFFAGIVHPFPREAASLAAYFERLLERPSVQATLAQARPWFSMFPYRDAMPDRFLAG